MSNSSLQPDQDALRESAIAVITYVRDAMHEGVALLREHNRLLVENQGEHRLESEIQAINENLRYVNQDLEKIKTKARQWRVTIVSSMKSGKSTIINAIAGQDLLPSRNDAMTVLPTEIVFSREVTRPKLILDKALMTLLREVWRQLNQKLQRIGLDKAIKQADFRHENAIKEIFSSSLFSLSEVEESNSIQSDLIKINDLMRLCGIFGISTEFLSSLSEIPRIKVPFSPQLSSLKGLENLVLVDTPSLYSVYQDKSLNLVNVVKKQLDFSSIILLVFDFTQLNSEASEKEKRYVGEIATIRGLESIYVLINKIDTRGEKDMTKEQVLECVNSKFGIGGSTDRVFEISASYADCVSNFWNVKKQGFANPQDMKTLDLLGELYYGGSWRKKFQKRVDMADMEEVATDVWSESGFAEFLEEKAIIPPLVIDEAPSMITIKSALKDVGDRLSSLSFYLKKKKEVLDKKVHEQNSLINKLNFDLEEAIPTSTSQAMADSIGDSLYEISMSTSPLFSKSMESDFRSALENEIKRLKFHLDMKQKIEDDLGGQYKTVVAKGIQRLGLSKYESPVSILQNDIAEFTKRYDLIIEKLKSINRKTIRQNFKMFLDEYLEDLQSELKATKQKQDTYVILANKYVQILDKIENLETDLKYQRKYFDSIK
jgi:hypothetical protein